MPLEAGPSAGLWLSNEALAFGVTLTSFVISGAFLLVGVTFAARLRDVRGRSSTQLETPRLTPAVDPPSSEFPMRAMAKRILCKVTLWQPFRPRAGIRICIITAGACSALGPSQG